jgi:hypothetical protein
VVCIIMEMSEERLDVSDKLITSVEHTIRTARCSAKGEITPRR